MTKDRASFVTAVYLFLQKDNQVLLSRRFNTGYEDGNYCVIAGHLELGEDIFTCLKREAKEEAGIIISQTHTNLFHIMTRKTRHDHLDLFFKTNKWQGTPKICEPKLCDDLSWFNLKKLPANTIPYIKTVLQTIHKNKITYTQFT